MDTPLDVEQFEREWVDLAEEVVRRVFANERIQGIKNSLRLNGRLSWEEKNEFITIPDQIKNDLIGERYGADQSPTYKQFLSDWQEWQKERGRLRDKPANLFEENISHFLYGSTPDPEEFLREFNLEDVK
jgi:hypothetical protein